MVTQNMAPLFLLTSGVCSFHVFADVILSDLWETFIFLDSFSANAAET